LIVERKYIDPEWIETKKLKVLDLSADGIMLWAAIGLAIWLQRYWSVRRPNMIGFLSSSQMKQVGEFVRLIG
jgi:hypothetical protein